MLTQKRADVLCKIKIKMHPLVNRNNILYNKTTTKAHAKTKKKNPSNHISVIIYFHVPSYNNILCHLFGWYIVMTCITMYVYIYTHIYVYNYN